ncbi:Heavy-metal-associated domain-containing protein [Tenacibaculum sp. 190130A14a]|uniref:Heavy-metal-associated domain-containing protein n=1 Tax=Tenacibaculum polynesiense TaxID=3137857 RepID=A0ABM9PE19_9FLAO
MKLLKIFFVVAFVSVTTIACKTEAKKEDATPKTEEVAANVQEASFAISGMTCEIGCAKKIASDLSKKEGVVDAKVVFTDSIATVKFDANKTNKAELMAFVDGIAESMYKTSELSKEACKKECEKKCSEAKTDAEKAACKKECEMACCSDKKEGTSEEKTACAKDCKMECCAETENA